MNYEEFLKATGAEMTEATFEQFRFLRKLYIDSDYITKRDIYRIWKKAYRPAFSSAAVRRERFA